MIFCILAALGVGYALPQKSPPTIELKAGLTITRSAMVKPLTYFVPNSNEEGKAGAIRITGSNIVIDFQGATLAGTPQTVEPDQRKGTGITVTGKNVTIKNLKVRGYKVGIAAWNASGLKLYNVDGSYNWKQRLLSDLDKEDGADWMSYHHNEKNEWLRYGAAFYLRGCDNIEVKGCKVTGGQCALMITDCNKGLIWNNDFSFLSAVGLGMYRASDNRIMHNKLDWCVRGFSYGKYNRGQDSTGILIYEQSHRNVFAYNSVTHGGDGFFLWAGQTTMDTGEGGCNDNLLYANDFSSSPANGIEATFSRNKFINNLMLECWHGIWGGYSYDTPIIGNVFGHNQESVAIEHGQNNTFAYNTIKNDHDGLVFWSNANPPDPNWGYPKHRDVRSRDYRIEKNDFERLSGNALIFRRSMNLTVDDNSFRMNANTLSVAEPVENLKFTNNAVTTPVPQPLLEKYGSSNAVIVNSSEPAPKPATALSPGQDLSTAEYLSWFKVDWKPYQSPASLAPVGRTLTTREQQVVACAPYYVSPMKGGMDPFLRPGALRGWKYILVDHWGPYDFKSPVLWPRGAPKNGQQTYEILGLAGSAKVVDQVGCKIESFSTNDGSSWKPAIGAAIPVPSLVKVAYGAQIGIERKLTLEYTGSAIIDYRGVATPKGRPFRFGYSEFFVPIDWTVKFYAWDDTNDPRTKPDAFQTLIGGNPVKMEKVDRVNYAGNVPGVPADHFATVGDGTFEIPPGDYVLNVTTDDGCRVWVDGELVIKDAWKYQGPTLYTAELKVTPGKHRIRVEHFEIDGYSALKVEIARK